MARKTIYISGKISGLADLNKPKFLAAKALIASKVANCELINPHELPDDHDKSWEAYMRECIKAVCVSDVVFVLDDWKDSRGALVEVLIAKLLGLPVYEVETMEVAFVPFGWLLVRLLTKMK